MVVGAELSVEEAYLKWSEDLVRYATALIGPADAPDVVSEAFMAVLDRGDGAWDAIGEPRGYLFRAVLNAVRMQERGRGRRERRERCLWEAEPAHELLGDPAVIDAVQELSVQQRAITYLTYWEDLRPADVAGMLGISEGSVRRQLARARTTLRKVLQ